MISRGLFCFAATVALLVMWIAPADAACPNKCSGHGACGANDVCACKQNWMGGDCSLRVCPYTRAWVDTPAYANDAHYYAECGNKGSCDRSTGVCNCDAGYTGSGCRRQACPNDCSGHGTCEFIEEFTTLNYNTQWDQEKIMGCKCDPGFEGHDCSSRICPKGDDPITSYDQNAMVQFVNYGPGDHSGVDAYGDIYLSYKDPYGNTWTTQSIDTSATEATTCSNIQTALRKLPNQAMKSVTVAAHASAGVALNRGSNDPVTSGAIASAPVNTVATGGSLCLITFPAAPGSTGFQNIITCHVGDHNVAGMQPKVPVTVMDTSVDICTTGEYATTNASPRKLTELATCSNRGICDGSTGDCQCFAGHRGLACETQEALV